MTVKFIAEIGSNHNRDISRARSLIEMAAEIGCWGVKFQLFEAEKLYAPEFKEKIKKMKEWELPRSFIVPIAMKCKECNVKFICTPFDLEAVDYLKSTVDYFKIGSYELLWTTLIEKVAATKIPWMFSAGMTEDITLIGQTIGRGLKMGNCPMAVLHCNSNYPAKPEHCNLSRIKDLAAFTNYPAVGWSDHTRNPELVLNAIGCGASIVEFHFDLEDRQGFESAFGHCWKPAEAKSLIERAKFLEGIGGKYPYHHSWVYSQTTGEDEAGKWRTDPEDGLRPLKKYREELLG